MARRIAALIVLATLAIPLTILPATAEDQPALAGDYVVKGWNPGNAPVGSPDYVGRATIIRWGDVWRYRSFMDNQTYAGAGLYDEKGRTMSFSFANGDGAERGVTVLRHDKDKLEGVWVMDTGDKGIVGHETWIKIK